MDEDDIQLILNQYNSNILSYQLSPGIYSIKGISEAVYIIADHEDTLKNEYDDISMKTKTILKQFGGTSEILDLMKNRFFNKLLDFTPYWDYKSTNAIHVDSPGVYTSDKNLKFTYNK